MDVKERVSVKLDPEVRAFLIKESELMHCTFSGALRYHLRLAVRYNTAIMAAEKKSINPVEWERGK
jgi:hypothetical protein